LARCGKVLEIYAIPSWMPRFLAHSSEYVEPYRLDGGEMQHPIRRDLKVGRMFGDAFMTTDDILIVR
jgi:hypothetical protein